MSEELHDVVKLLIARMETHPEEFGGDLVASGSIEERWWSVIREVHEYGTETERNAINAAMREIKMQHAHELMMDELCNGEERRRKEREEEEYYERTLINSRNSMGASLRATIAPALDRIDQQTYFGGGDSSTTAISPNHTVTASTIAAQSTLTVGKEILDESTITKIKKALKL